MAGWLSTLLPSASGASTPAPVPAPLLAPIPAPIPALYAAQEALQDDVKERRKEDLEIEVTLKEVLSLAKKYRPANTMWAYKPKQREWQVSGSFKSYFIFYMYYI